MYAMCMLNRRTQYEAFFYVREGRSRMSVEGGRADCFYSYDSYIARIQRSRSMKSTKKTQFSTPIKKRPQKKPVIVSIQIMNEIIPFPQRMTWVSFYQL